MYPLLRARCKLNHHVSQIISNASHIKYRFGMLLHSKFGLISDKSTHPLLTFASSSGLKFVIFDVIISCVFMNFSNFFVISFGVILILNSQVFFVLYSANHALQLKITGHDSHRCVNKIFH